MRTFADIMKSEPSVSAVHVSTALGNMPNGALPFGPDGKPNKRRRAKPFSAFISGATIPRTFGPTPVITAVDKIYHSVDQLPAAVHQRLGGRPKKLRQWMHVWNLTYAEHKDEGRAFAGAWAAVQKSDTLSGQPLVGLRDRALQPFDAGTYHVPFRYSPAALATLRPDQVPRFLDAATHPKRLPTREVALSSLSAIKDRVSRESTGKHLEALADGKPPKPPTVARMAGTDHIVDGHDRLAAAWLNGDEHATVRHVDLDPFSEEKPDPTVNHEGSRFNLLQPANGRRLTWNANGTLAVPFTYDPTFLSSLRPDQVPRFMWAITHQKKLPKARVPLLSLRAIQDRVNPDTVAAHVENPTHKPPVVVRVNGTNYIGDGHDRLAARWLSGDDEAKVRFADLGALPTNDMKPTNAEWGVPFEVKKVDPDKQMVFGWASVSTIGGVPVTDKQGDIIPVDELESAFYDYVLNSRDMGHMHAKKGVGRLIECVVVTAEKQTLWGVDFGLEGAWVGFLVDDPDIWAAHKRGELPEFSIGGAAVSEKIA